MKTLKKFNSRRELQVLRILHTLLHQIYSATAAVKILNSLKIEYSVCNSIEVYIHCSFDMANLLLEASSDGIYVGRNVLFISDIKNNREAIKSSFDRIPKGTLPLNMAKSPLLIELAKSKSVAKASLPEDLTTNPDVDPHKDSSKPAAGKKQFRHNR